VTHYQPDQANLTHHTSQHEGINLVDTLARYSILSRYRYQQKPILGSDNSC